MELQIDRTNKLQCQKCGRLCAKHCSVIAHVKRSHGIESKAYYDEFFKKDDEGVCKYCGKPVPYRDLQNGYREFCDRTCFWRYTTQSNAVKAKREQTCLTKYGTKQYMATKDFKEKSAVTNEKLYNAKNVFSSPEVIAKIKATKLAKHDDEHYNNYAKAQQTKLKKYNDKNYNNRPKAQQTWLANYNELVTTPFAIPIIRQNIVNNWSKKYNTAISTPLQIASVRKQALNHAQNMTKPEKRLYEFLNNRKFEFQYGYECNGKIFDFAIFNSGKLNILIEIDGLYYHGLTEDRNGKHVRGETDCERFSKVPEGVKFIVCDENKLQECFAEILKVFNVDYNEWIQSIVQSLPTEFPYPTYTDSRMQNDWKHLCTWMWKEKSYVGTSIIRHFHHSIYSANLKNKLSPVECWSNKELLKKTVENRIIYSSSLSSQNIVEGFNICKIAPKVTVFNPMLAKKLIQTYLSDVQEIFDPFSGFSGRMLGACAVNKTYIGRDINQTHIQESQNIINFLHLSATVECKNIFTDSGEYDSLFTCPPYSNKEIWNNSDVNMTCDQWIDECLKRFNCKKYLFVVDTTEKYKDHIVETIENKSHFGSNTEYVILVNK